MIRIGFLINPIAGMGGRVGLKGTDGVVEKAIELGARPLAQRKSFAALRQLHQLLHKTANPPAFRWVTCSGVMGADSLRAVGFTEFDIAYEPAAETSDNDTKSAVSRFIERGVDLVLFCGGDGTARDVCGITGQDTPILGIPSGVKMYSGVFGTNPARTAEILFEYLQGKLASAEAEVLDLDEEKYRQGEWAVRLYHAALTPYEPTFTQSAKMMISEMSDTEAKMDISKHLFEEFGAQPDVLLFLGAGSTVQAIGDAFHIDKTVLGVDAVAEGRLVGKDLNERQILDLIDRFPDRKLILSPIGAQGFVLGRGNLQLSPEVVRKIGRKNIIIVATPAKLSHTPVMRFDTGDSELDMELLGSGYVPVVTGYGLSRIVKAAI